jgi:hypothetical protein
MTKKKEAADALTDLLSEVRSETLIELIGILAAKSPDLRQECFNYLKKHVSLTAEQKTRAEQEIVMALWLELSPDLEELDSYGGGDHGTVDNVADLLYDIQKKLADKKIERKIRRDLIDEVLPFIKSGNAGLDDTLYDVAYAACYDDDDWRSLAQSLEEMKKEWPIDHARRIYRKLGDREKYFELRRKKLLYGGDYHDLAMFYWNEGNRKQALDVAEEGMKKGQGRMDELRKFLADRAREGGNRDRYLELQLAQTTDCLTLAKYTAFKKICTAEEWKAFEPRLLERLANAWAVEQLKIHMHREEYDLAVAVLLKGKYPTYAWDSTDELRMAAKLETLFPEQILTYYISSLGNLNINGTRKEYAQKAKIMLKVRHILLDVLKVNDRWKTFACKVKRDNLRRTAFQEEFNRVVPGWRELV